MSDVEAMTPPRPPAEPRRRARPLARLAASGFAKIAAISASLIATQAVTSVLGLVFWVLAARLFSTTDVGVAGAAVAMMMLLGSFGSLSLGTVLIARLPETDAGERRVLIRTCVAVAATGGALLGLVVPWVAVRIFGASGLEPLIETPWALLGLALGISLTSMVMVLDQAVLTIGVGVLQFERNLIASGGKIVVLVALAIAGLHGGMWIFLAWTIGNLVSLPLVAWRTRGGRALAAGRRLIEPRLLHGIAKMTLSHHALNVTIQATSQLLPILVTVLVSAAANAAFNTAAMLAGFVFVLPYTVSIGLFAAARGDAAELVKRMRLTIPFGLLVSAVAALVLFPLAPFILQVFGPSYAAEGTILLRIVVFAGLALVIKDHFIALKRVQGRTTQALAVTSVFLVLELAGAATGAVIGGAAGLCIGWVAVLTLEALGLAVPLVRELRAAKARERSAAVTAEAAA